jgi:hypothetical protein
MITIKEIEELLNEREKLYEVDPDHKRVENNLI